MKKNKNSNKKNYLGMIIVTFLISCTDDNIYQIPLQQTTQTSSDYIQSEAYLSRVIYEIENSFITNINTSSLPFLTFSNTNSLDNDTLIIDFGSSNFLYNGKFLKGKIINIYTGKISNANFFCNSSFDNFQINNKSLNGQIVYEVVNVDDKNNKELTIMFNNCEITDVSGKVNWSSTQNRIQISGGNTTDLNDDIYFFSSTSSGNSRSKINFISNADSLEIDYSCYNDCLITNGSSLITFQQDNETIRKILFSSENCECQYQIKINNDTYPLYLD